MRTLAAVLALSLSLPVLARDVAGVQVPDSVTVGGKALLLNGAGLRSKLFIKVYVGALYLEQRSSDPAAIVAADAAWQVAMTFKRDVDKASVLGAFKDGFENNSKADAPKLVPALARIDAVMKDLKSGDVLVIAYAPGAGLSRLDHPALFSGPLRRGRGVWREGAGTLSARLRPVECARRQPAQAAAAS